MLLLISAKQLGGLDEGINRIMTTTKQPKLYNFIYIRSFEARNIKEAREIFKDMLEDLTGTDIYESGEVEEDKLPD